MIICLGPFCVPIWPLFFLVAMPIWDRLPESWRESLSNIWDTKIYPTCVKPVLDRLPETVKKMMLFGIRRGQKKEAKQGNNKKQEGDNKSTQEETEQAINKNQNQDAKQENQLRQRKEINGGNKTITDTVSEVSKASSNYPRGKVVAVSSDEEFEEIVKAENLSQYRAVYLDFTATWCKPCQTIKPVFAELAEKHPDALFCMIDADECEDAHAMYDVTSLPTIVKVDANAEAETNESARLRLATAEKLQAFVAA